MENQNENNNVLGENEQIQGQVVETEPQEEPKNNTEQKQDGNQEQPLSTDQGENNDNDNNGTSFTQEQVNDIVRNRLEKAKSTIYNRYGVKDKEELDALVGKAQSYDVMSEDYTKVTEELNAIKQENAFLKNNVEPSKIDDIKAYFKGKDLELNAETLKTELETHKEWEKVNQASTTIKTLSSEEPHKTEVSEKEKVLKLFGY